LSFDSILFDRCTCRACENPKLVEALHGYEIVDVACGGAHSAAITSNGQLYTWGKGRYGRLGHGDSEDQLKPKLVEELVGYKVIDVACGSGDAQTLCITDDDNVWSWGDGDYGKLGRGGSDGCKVPKKIESLAGLGVVKVECGSQFSVALTRSGSVYTWGKGDYHRLGHGTGEHVRRPKKVAALQGKKIISIATGSLHCVACSDEGEVFTWGDNDEGQLGDDTTNAIQRPRLVSALQGKKITNVACGSAHTLAWSTNNASSACARLPSVAPLEYDLLQDIPTWVLHRRLILLYHFAELICPCITMFPITGPDSLHELRSILIYTIKEATFRKVVQATMVRDKHHGPVIELNRIQVKRSRSRGGLAGVDGMKSVFGQMVMKLGLLTSETLALPHRVWKVEFVGKFDASFLCTWIVFWCGRGERRRLRRRLQREHRRDVRRTPKRFLAVVDSDTERARRRRPQPGLFHPEPVVQDLSQLEHVQVFGGADGNRDPHRFAAQLEPGRACVETTGRDRADAG
jgi:E3 ubiquitin-protein ligase HERC2